MSSLSLEDEKTTMQRDYYDEIGMLIEMVTVMRKLIIIIKRMKFLYMGIMLDTFIKIYSPFDINSRNYY